MIITCPKTLKTCEITGCNISHCVLQNVVAIPIQEVAQQSEIPEPFNSWLCDLNNALNVLRSNNYDDQSKNYANVIHMSYLVIIYLLDHEPNK